MWVGDRNGRDAAQRFDRLDNGLVEQGDTVPQVSELRDLGAKCVFHRVRFGILVARAGTSGGHATFKEPQNAELVRRRFQVEGLTLLVLDQSQLRGKARELRGVQDDLSADHRVLVFGPMP